MMAAMIVLIGHAGFSQVFEKNSQAINIDIGFGNVNYWGSYYSGFLPSISGSYEYGIVEIPMGSDLTGVISVGGYLGASMAFYGPYGYDSQDWRRTNLIMAARGNYHFIFHDQLDTYAGLALGIDLAGQKYIGDGTDPGIEEPSAAPFGGVYAGARWYFTDNFAVNAEVGWLISVLNLGVTFKF